MAAGTGAGRHPRAGPEPGAPHGVAAERSGAAAPLRDGGGGRGPRADVTALPGTQLGFPHGRSRQLPPPSAAPPRTAPSPAPPRGGRRDRPGTAATGSPPALPPP